MQKKNESAEETSLSCLKKKFMFFFMLLGAIFRRMFLPIFQEYAKRNPHECLSVLVDNKANLCDKYEIEYYPTVLLFKKGKVDKRLDATPGAGLTKKQLTELTENRKLQFFNHEVRRLSCWLLVWLL